MTQNADYVGRFQDYDGSAGAPHLRAVCGSCALRHGLLPAIELAERPPRTCFLCGTVTAGWEYVTLPHNGSSGTEQ